MLGSSNSGSFPGLGIIEGWLKSITQLLGQINQTISSVFPPALTSSTTWNPPSLASGSSQLKTVTVAGAKLGQSANASFSLDLGGTTLSAYVSAADTITVAQSNLTGGAVDLGSGTLKVWAYQQ